MKIYIGDTDKLFITVRVRKSETSLLINSKRSKPTFFPRHKNKGDKKGNRKEDKTKAINSFTPTCRFTLQNKEKSEKPKEKES